MDKFQAYHNFWSSFGWAAYDESSVPDMAVFPYITYEAAVDSFPASVALTASLWSRSGGWSDIAAMEKIIANTITIGGTIIQNDEGAFWIKKGQPWAQRMGDASDDMVKRIVLNIELEFIE